MRTSECGLADPDVVPIHTAVNAAPACASNDDGSVTSMPVARACSTTAAARGCSERSSALAMSRSTSFSPISAQVTQSTTSGRPTVSVPVLSNATTSIFCAISSACALLIRMPRLAPRPVPTMIAVGVASPSAQGQAMMRTAMNAVTAWANRGSGPRSHHAIAAAVATANTTGTKIEATAVDQTLDRRLRSLRFLDQAHDLGESRVGADARRAETQRPAGVERSAGDVIARALLHRDRLAGEHRLVHRRGARDDHAVGRDRLAWADDDHVADLELVDRDILFNSAGASHAR